MNESRKRNILIWLIASILALMLVIFVVAQIVIPPIVEKKLYTAISPFFVNAKEFKLDISSTPTIEMLFGRIDSVSLRAVDFMIDDIPVTSLLLTAKDLVINQNDLKSGNPINNADITLVMTTEQVKERFLSRISSLDSLTVDFSQDRVSLLGEVSVFGLAVEIEASGALIVLPGNVVSFEVEEINLDNTLLGSTILNLAKELINFRFSLGELPWGITLQEIDITREYVTFYGYMRN